MSAKNVIKAARRSFLKQAAGLTASIPLSPVSVGGVGLAALTTAAGAAATDAGASPAAAFPGYQSLGPDEAAFVEAMVNIMCPPDELTPGGVDCGLAVFIDRQLAGAFGKGARRYLGGPWIQGKPQLGYQLPLSPEQFFKAGVAAADEAARLRFGRSLTQLSVAEGSELLQGIGSGKVTHERLSLSAWFNELVYPLFVQACFSDPIYGGNRDKVFWRMIGYPGLPATHTLDMVRYRGRQYPGASDPKSIIDFS
jgi:gluconate 2-dehydrogenase gamma chain